MLTTQIYLMMRTNKFYNIKRFFDVTDLTNKYLVSILNSRTLGFYITYFFYFFVLFLYNVNKHCTHSNSYYTDYILLTSYN